MGSACKMKEHSKKFKKKRLKVIGKRVVLWASLAL